MRTMQSAPMRRLVALSLFLFTSSLFAGGREITPAVYGPAPYSLSQPRVATNGKTFLTTWTLQREPQSIIFFGSIADADGHVLTPVPFVIATAPTPLDDVVAVGSEYLLVWSDYDGTTHTRYLSSDGSSFRDGPALNLRPGYLTRLASDGNTLLALSLTATQGEIALNAQLMKLDGSTIRNMKIASANLPVDI